MMDVGNELSEKSRDYFLDIFGVEKSKYESNDCAQINELLCSRKTKCYANYSYNCKVDICVYTQL